MTTRMTSFVPGACCRRVPPTSRTSPTHPPPGCSFIPHHQPPPPSSTHHPPIHIMQSPVHSHPAERRHLDCEWVAHPLGTCHGSETARKPYRRLREGLTSWTRGKRPCGRARRPSGTQGSSTCKRHRGGQEHIKTTSPQYGGATAVHKATTQWALTEYMKPYKYAVWWCDCSTQGDYPVGTHRIHDTYKYAVWRCDCSTHGVSTQWALT